jgi:hypothetical protein
MKRLVWILLAVVGTAFAQVQPVTLTSPHHKCTCCCCGGDGSCGMPGCLPPAPARTQLTANQPASITVTAARRVAEPVRTAEKFFAAFVEPAAAFAASRAPERVTPPASVPLFAAHCSLLI